MEIKGYISNIRVIVENNVMEKSVSHYFFSSKSINEAHTDYLVIIRHLLLKVLTECFFCFLFTYKFTKSYT